MSLTVLDLCSGVGGEALGLEAAGFVAIGAVDVDRDACETLRLNRPNWNVWQQDLKEVGGDRFRGVDLVAGGVPCPPFSIAGKQLGHEDERDLFPEALRIIEEASPRAVLLENVRGFAGSRFEAYRTALFGRLSEMGYECDWKVLNSADFGVPQLRRRFVLVGLRERKLRHFRWPQGGTQPPTVGDSIGDLMASGGWAGAQQWRQTARGIAPTLVGGSKKHGGPDLGPTRARREWARLGVDGLGVADQPPTSDFPVDGRPRLTVRMAARIQGLPDSWRISGRKTAAYRQVGNAFPPPVARAVGIEVRAAIEGVRYRPDDRAQLRLLDGAPLYA